MSKMERRDEMMNQELYDLMYEVDDVIIAVDGYDQKINSGKRQILNLQNDRMALEEKINTPPYVGEKPKFFGEAGCAMWFVLLIFWWFVLPELLILYAIRKNKYDKACAESQKEHEQKRKVYEKKCSEIDLQIQNIQKQVQKWSDERNKYLSQHWDHLLLLPPEFRNPQATEFMLTAVEYGRANTLGEAMNLYEQERNYREWMGKMDRIESAQKKQRQHMNDAIDQVISNQKNIAGSLHETEEELEIIRKKMIKMSEKE